MGTNQKRLVFLSRLLVIITIAYILILAPGRENSKLWGYAFIAFYLATNLVIHYLPEKVFSRSSIFYCIVIVDCLLIVAGIYLSGMEGSDLYLVFFVIVCLATLGSELKNLVIASFIFVFIYGWLLYQQGLLQGEMAVSYSLRLPFILVVALFLGYIVDTQTKEQKERLKVSERRYRSFVDNLPIGVYQQTAGDNGRFLLINNAFSGLFGYEDKEIRKVDPDGIYADHEQRLEMERRLEQGQMIEGHPLDLRRRDGSVFNARIWARKFTHDQENIVEGVIVDVTELRKAERALAESEERLRLAGKASYDLVYEWQTSDNRLRWFGDIDKKLGFPSAKISENQELWLRLIHPADAKSIHRPGKVNTADMGVNACEYRIRHNDGSWRYWSDHSLPVMDEKGNIAKWIGVCTDITRNKEIEQQLHQAQKMEAIGVLAGGVAHNFNNMMMGIMGHVSTMLMDKDSSDPDYEELKYIYDSIKEASALTKNLLGFARGGAYEVLPVNLNELIIMENQLFCSARKNVRIHEHLAENLWNVSADKSQLQQILMNLYVNAVQAMPEAESGDIFVQTENVLLNEQEALSRQLQSGKYVKVMVRDTGCGMDENILGKIFDPFFTTKKPGEGTGLGLSSVYGIINNHSGAIEVDSKIGEGSTFIIYLPATDKVAAIKEEDDRPEIVNGSGVILIVDDEKMVLKSCERLLKRLNYQILTARNGREAIAAYGQNAADIDLVILDMLMPDMNGGIVFEELKKIDPAVNVLLSSGFSCNDQAQDILSRGCRGFIQKPFDIQEISQKIKEMIRRPADIGITPAL